MWAGIERIGAAIASAAVTCRLPCGPSLTVEPQRGHSARWPRAGASTCRVSPQVGQRRTSGRTISVLQQITGHDHPAPTTMTAPRSFAALRQPRFRLFFLGVASVMMADAIEHVISYWVLFEKFHSPPLAGFAIVSHWLPFLLFSVYSGAAADRHDPRRIIQIGMALFMAASLAWGFLFFTDTLRTLHAAVLLIVHGCAGATWGPSAQVLIHHMVEPQTLPSAVRLTATARWAGLMLGPALGAPLLLLLGPTYGILVNALIYLPFMLWVRTIPFSRKASPPPLRGFGDVAAAARVVAANRVLASMTLLAGCASLLVGNAYHAQLPEFARDFGHVDADITYSLLFAADALGALTAGLVQQAVRDFGHVDADITYSLLFAADALGALTAGLVLESRGLLPPRARTAFVLAILWCLAIGSFALSASYPLALALLFAAGFLELSFYAMAQTLVQLHAPPEMRGRVIGVFVMSAMGLRAFSGVTVGGGSLIGIHASLAISAGVLFALLAFGFAIATRWRS